MFNVYALLSFTVKWPERHRFAAVNESVCLCPAAAAGVRGFGPAGVVLRLASGSEGGGPV